jgi:hypothetical protein
MNKTEITQMTDTELFVAFHKITVQSVKESNSRGGERKGTMKVESWIHAECAKRFNVDVEALKNMG